MNAECWKALAGAVTAFLAQLYFESLPIGAMCGLLVMIVTGSIKWKDMDEIINGGVAMMGFTPSLCRFSRWLPMCHGNPLCVEAWWSAPPMSSIPNSAVPS